MGTQERGRRPQQPREQRAHQAAAQLRLGHGRGALGRRRRHHRAGHERRAAGADPRRARVDGRPRAGDHRRGRAPQRAQRRDARQRAPGERARSAKCRWSPSRASSASKSRSATFRRRWRTCSRSATSCGAAPRTKSRSSRVSASCGSSSSAQIDLAEGGITGETLAGTFHGKPHGSVESADKSKQRANYNGFMQVMGGFAQMNPPAAAGVQLARGDRPAVRAGAVALRQRRTRGS